MCVFILVHLFTAFVSHTSLLLWELQHSHTPTVTSLSHEPLQENIGKGSDTIFQFVFNKTKGEACSTAAASDPHAGHDDHRRADDDHDHEGDEKKFVAEINIQQAGAYVIFSNVDWINDYEGAIYAEGNETALAPGEVELVDAINYCPTAIVATTTTVHVEDLDTRKYIFSAIMFVVAFIGFMLPVLLGNVLSEDKVTTVRIVGNVFAAGVLFTVAVQHIIPETLHLLPPGKTEEYPAAMTCVVAGFVLMMLIESVFHHGQLAPAPKEPATHVHCASEPNCDVEVMVATEIPVSDEGDTRQCCATGVPVVGKPDEDVPKTTPYPPVMEMTSAEVPEETPTTETPSNVTGVLLLTLGLGIHSVFEGMALGLAINETATDGLFTGICAHKAFAALSLGSVLITQCKNTMAVAALGLGFSLLTSVGVWIGIAVEHASTNEVNGVISSVAAGIILYVALFELLQPLNSKDAKNVASQLVLALVFLAGCAVIALVAIHNTQEGGAHDH